MEEPASCVYELDDELRIIWVDTSWSQFAVANQAPELALTPGPIGRSAVACTADSTSAFLYTRLFQRVLETQSAISLPFRCDAPARRRYLNLVIRPRTPAGLRVETTLTRVEDRSPVALLDRNAPRDRELLRLCGWCKAAHVGGRWCEVEDAVAEMRLFERDRLPHVTHGICSRCHERVSRELQRE